MRGEPGQKSIVSLMPHEPARGQDLLAGLTGAIAGAPQAMSFALLAGVSPLYGLYAAIIPTIVGSLFASSTFITIAPTNVLMLLVASGLSRYGNPDPPLQLFTLTLLIGGFQVLFGILRLGNLTRFVSNAVIVGFISGAGVLIVIGQIDHLIGVRVASGQNALAHIWYWLLNLPKSHPHTVIIGVSTILIVYILRHTQFKHLAVLVAITLTTVFIQLAGWADVRLTRDLSAIPSGLPQPSLPDPRYIPDLLSAAFAIALLACVQSAALAENTREPDGSTPQVNRDFIGHGFANVIGSLFQCLPVSGSLSRTAVNLSAGARTRLANVLAGVFIGLFLLALSSMIERIALAALAGQLIVAALGLIDRKAIRLTWQTGLSSRVVILTTFSATLVLPLEYSIYLGILLSTGFYLYNSVANVRIVQLEITEDGQFRQRPVPAYLPSQQVIILSISGSLYFAAAKRLEELLPSPNNARKPVVILRLRDSSELASTGIRILQRYAQRLRARGGKLILAGVTPQVQGQLQHTGLLDELGAESVFQANDVVFAATRQALAYARTWLVSEPAVMQLAA